MNTAYIKKEKIIEIIWFVVVVTLFIFSFKMLRSGELQMRVASFGMLAPAVIVLLKMTTLVVAPLGGTPIYVLSGALFGNFQGFLISIIGDVLGSSACFFLSRRYGEKVLRSLVGGQNVERVVGAVNIIGSTKSFIKARIGFMSMPELLAYAAGLSRINFWIFTLINTLFYIPVDFVLVYLGSRIAELSAKYFLIVPAVVFLFTLVGFALLYKDYEKIETM
jgi:uncharacterized membrane protein YdjX (TVP38/TMEM64 family)